jgi:FkbM family methyltransferase
MSARLLKSLVRAVRAWGPINKPLTTTLRAGLRLFGSPSDRVARYLPRVGLVKAPLPAGGVLRMWSIADEAVSSRVYWLGWNGHEPETSTLFYQLASASRLVFDIGAHVGYFALLAAHANPSGRVFAFEPLPRAHERLEHNVALNGLENVECVAIAAGNQTGTAELISPGHGIPSGSTLAREYIESLGIEEPLATVQVQVVKIDEFMETSGLEGLDLVKIDTEATEDRVIAGMAATLARDRPVVICEVVSQSPGEAIEGSLASLDYRFFLLTGDGSIERDHITVDPVWRNYCLVPGEAVERFTELRERAQ